MTKEDKVVEFLKNSGKVGYVTVEDFKESLLVNKNLKKFVKEESFILDRESIAKIVKKWNEHTSIQADMQEDDLNLRRKIAKVLEISHPTIFGEQTDMIVLVKDFLDYETYLCDAYSPIHQCAYKNYPLNALDVLDDLVEIDDRKCYVDELNTRITDFEIDFEEYAKIQTIDCLYE